MFVWWDFFIFFFFGGGVLGGKGFSVGGGLIDLAV